MWVNIFATFCESIIQSKKVAYVSLGPHAGKLFMIVDVIDQSRALADGPLCQVRRQAVPFKCMPLTDSVVKFPHSACRYQTGAATRWAKKIETRERKARMTDSDHYKVMKAKKMRSRIANNNKRSF
uniref:Large ribosomal subunit protein eL14 n=1 Tax=Panthera leo TaxID=9689 RepID=A0A8C8WIZ5_PANLE